MPNTVALLGGFERKEAQSTAAAIVPGELLERNATSQVLRHAGAGLRHGRLFALENDLIGGAIGDAYANSSNIVFGAFAPGAEVNAIASAAITEGDYVESDGVGRLRVVVVDAATDDTQRQSLVGVALAAASGAGVRVRVELL